MGHTLPEINIKVPAGFLLGAAISAHQVEGNNVDSDWWHWEKQGRVPESGQACDHYNRYSADFQIARDIGLNAMRISIEWARIEPEQGKWDHQAVEHYRQVLKDMKSKGLSRMVTLHHFTLPQWLALKGGFETQDGVEAFARYSWFVAENLGDEIDLWCTINEPEVFSSQGYYKGIWPPFKRNALKLVTVYRNLTKAHIRAYRAIKSAKPQAEVGIVKNNVHYEPYQGNPVNRMACAAADYFGNRWFLDRIRRDTDFIGLNFYFTRVISIDFSGAHVANSPERPKSDMGWQTFPEGIYHALSGLKRYGKPVYVTENGIANARDDMRMDYIRQHIGWALKARAEGLDLRGYYYWSLMDNYEWSDGFGPLFGLVEVDYSTQARKVRPSAAVVKELMNA